MRSSDDESGFGSWGLIATATFGGRNTDEASRRRTRASGGCGEFRLDDTLDVIDTNQDVFRFEILFIRHSYNIIETIIEKITCVDDSATPMHVIETEQNLFRDLFDKLHGDALVLVSFDET